MTPKNSQGFTPRLRVELQKVQPTCQHVGETSEQVKCSSHVQGKEELIPSGIVQRALLSPIRPSLYPEEVAYNREQARLD